MKSLAITVLAILVMVGAGTVVHHLGGSEACQLLAGLLASVTAIFTNN